MSSWVSSTTLTKVRVLLLRIVPALLLLASNTWAVADNLTLKEDVMVANGLITLQSVIHQTLPVTLAQTAICQSPRVGQILRLPKHKIEKLIKFNASGQWTLQGPPEVLISLQTQAIKTDVLVNTLKSQIEEHYWYDEGNLEVQPLMDEELVLPVGDVEFKVSNIQPKQLRKNIRVWVDVLIDTQHYQTMRVAVMASHKKLAYVARVNLTKGSKVTEQDFAYKLIDSLQHNVFKLDLSQQAWQLKRALQQGELLLKNHIKHAPVVSEGTTVMSMLANSSVALEMPLKAMQAGMYGDIIRATRINNNTDEIMILLQQKKSGATIGMIQ